MQQSASTIALRRTAAREQWAAKTNADLYITVGMGTCGLAAGAQDSLAMVETELLRRGLSAQIGRVGCVGMCSYEPMIELQTPGRAAHQLRQAPPPMPSPRSSLPTYESAALRTPWSSARWLPDTMLHDGSDLQHPELHRPATQRAHPLSQDQLRIVLSNCGLIDPESHR